ncbi:MAG TPA: pyridoxal phosphate-dependent aminotransferase [Candidatus Eisenbacteria bacterium]|nr:pyridoxal phosphate-dependent aminotransferase [Candidatus Eisenbacteria bacterium]
MNAGGPRRSRLSARVPDDFEPNPLARLLAEKRARGVRILDLTISNPTRVGLDYGPPPTLALPDAYEPEPRGSLAAREAVARYYAEREGRDTVSPDRLVLTSSTSESYAHLLRLLCDPGDDVLVPTPSYPLFEPLARLEGVEIREYALQAASTPSGGWTGDPDSMEAAAGPRTRAIFLVQPNNPTGSCVQPEELGAIEAVVERLGIALVSDEVFGDFPWPPATRPLPTLLAEPRRGPTFVLGGVSKLCGLPQMKLGWIAVAGPDREMGRATEGLEWIADLFLSTSGPSEAALPSFLDGRHRFQIAMRERLAANLGLLRSNLVPGRTPFQLLEAEGGWSAVLRQREHAQDVDPGERLLDRHDILVHPGHFYGLSDDHIVISLIVEPSVLEEALGRLM